MTNDRERRARRSIRWLVLALALVGCRSAPSAPETGFLDRSLRGDGEVRHYQVFVPRNYDHGKEWPVILFLHGSRQVGDDGYRPTADGIGSAIRQEADRFPALVVFPQARHDLQWVDSEASFALRALEAAQREFHIDEERVYLTGLSRGGRGVYHLANGHVDRFAAVLPVCGHVDDYEGRLPALANASNEEVWAVLAERFARTPFWIFHGGEDPVIPVEQSRRLVAELEARGAPVHYTELPGEGHNAWDAAYGPEGAIEWLLAQRRRVRPSGE